jgi:hypothetical protein
MNLTNTFLVAAATTVLTSTGLAANYEDLVKEGYRWAAVDGPLACPAKRDAQEIIKHSGDGIRLQMVEQLRAYYLVRGTIVKVVTEDPASGLAEIQIAGIIPELWTPSNFLSTRPIPDVDGQIETPAAADSAAPMAPLPLSPRPSGGGPVPGTNARTAWF